MKQLIYFSILLLPFLGLGIEPDGSESKTPEDQNALTPAHILKNYQVVWGDEFEGTAVNTSKWNYRADGTVRKDATVSRNTMEVDGKGCVLIKVTNCPIHIPYSWRSCKKRI
jgi:hypothetical protein